MGESVLSQAVLAATGKGCVRLGNGLRHPHRCRPGHRFGEWVTVLNIPTPTVDGAVWPVPCLRVWDGRDTHVAKCSSAADLRRPGVARPPLWYLFCLKGAIMHQRGTTVCDGC